MRRLWTCKALHLHQERGKARRAALGLAWALLLATTAALDCSDPEAAGRALQADGDWDGAAKEFERALKECGEDAGVFNSLGQALWQAGNPEEALLNFKRAVEMDPRNPFMVYNLGSLLHWEGRDLTAAEIALEKAVQLSDEQGGNEMLSQYAARARERCRSAAAMRINQERIELEKVRRVSSLALREREKVRRSVLSCSYIHLYMFGYLCMFARLISHGLTATKNQPQGRGVDRGGQEYSRDTLARQGGEGGGRRCL